MRLLIDASGKLKSMVWNGKGMNDIITGDMIAVRLRGLCGIYKVNIQYISQIDK